MSQRVYKKLENKFANTIRFDVKFQILYKKC